MKKPEQRAGHFVSFGGGVQSTAIAVLVLNRDARLIDAVGGALPDVFLFADTGSEPASVYRNVAACFDALRARQIECHTIARWQYAEADQEGWKLGLQGRLLKHLHRASEPGGTERNVPWIPAFVRTADGGSAPLQRRCTYNFKVETLERATRRLARIPRGYKGEPLVSQWLGISVDEAHRMKESRHEWQRFLYPLVDMGWRRSDCLHYLEEHGWHPPKSACYFCPFHSDKAWQSMRETEPWEFERAVQFERELQHAYRAIANPTLDSMPYLHASRVPLDQVGFAAQGDLFGGWGNDCTGTCGV